MGRYLLRRLLIAIPSLLGISVILFTVLALAPGDPFEELATNPNVPPEVRAALRAKFGLDDPVAVRYFRWLAAMLQGDWGFSFASRIDVDTLILQRLPATLFVIGSAQILALADRHSGRRLRGDAALLALRPDREHLRLHRLLAADLLHRPAVHPGLQHPARLAALRLSRRHRRDRLALVLGAPAPGDHADLRCSACSRRASMTRYVRSAVLDVIRLDYVTTARAKGLGERVVIIKHVVRNALIPVVTLVALQMPAIFGGAIVTEQIFRIPGIGSLLISAILANDTPVIMAVTFVFACLVVFFNLIADVLYGWLDPRITLG